MYEQVALGCLKGQRSKVGLVSVGSSPSDESIDGLAAIAWGRVWPAVTPGSESMGM